MHDVEGMNAVSKWCDTGGAQRYEGFAMNELMLFKILETSEQVTYEYFYSYDLRTSFRVGNVVLKAWEGTRFGFLFATKAKFMHISVYIIPTYPENIEMDMTDLCSVNGDWTASVRQDQFCW
ncbi:hypothetical protein VNO77_36749 [Canavalia gladiata]|uniref:Uncharacterized protein n=1 Tax=Canavalia gladiata TaxID=3824 RepID=A0AAN9K9E9_CANGL